MTAPSRRLPRPRRTRTVSLALAAAAALAVPAGASAYADHVAAHPAAAPAAAAFAAARPVGIVDATPTEQAAILSRMHVTGSRTLQGYRFWTGTMGGVPVVNVASGEDDEAAELVTTALDLTFHPRATLFAGTAGSANNRIDVGDVVLSGFVVDKRVMRYGENGTQTPINSAETHRSAHSDLRGALVLGHDQVFPTPADAKTYPTTHHRTDPRWSYLAGFAGTRALVRTAEAAPDLGSTPLSDATGHAGAKGSVHNKIVVGAVSGGAIWTSPLSWTEAQNGLYQTDAEEDEGLGFAFANASAGVPWLLVRGISDSPWYPNAYDGVLGAARAATVAQYAVTHLGGGAVAQAPASMSDLSRVANATRAGYLVADETSYTVSPVTRIRYTDGSGHHRTLTGPGLRRFRREYAPGSGDLG